MHVSSYPHGNERPHSSPVLTEEHFNQQRVSRKEMKCTLGSITPSPNSYFQEVLKRQLTGDTTRKSRRGAL